MEKTKKLIIVGAGEFGEIAYEYFTADSLYEVEAFAVEKEYLNTKELFGRPIIALEEMAEKYSPQLYETFVAVTYPKLNRERTRLYNICKEKGYKCATYISSRAFVWENVELGENVFIFENNVVQYRAKIGNNVILWSGNHIGHRSVIEDNCWLTSHDVISGFCRVGKNSFLGVNVSVGDRVTIPEDTVLGAGSVTVKNLEDKGFVYIGSPAKKTGRTSYEQFGVTKL